jgi:hypothetical protein
MSIIFTWDPVPGANTYDLILYQEGGLQGEGGGERRLIRRWESSARTFQTLELSFLGNGSFIWQVEARRLAADGSIERRGIPAENRFTVDIPALPRGTAKEPEKIYGQ